MTHQRPMPGHTRITSISLGVLLLLPAAFVRQPVETVPSTTLPAHLRLVEQAGSTTSDPLSVRSGGLEDCPDLRRGQRDPIDGMRCVRALQVALGDAGYPGQAITGLFGPQTEANVRDFQRRHGIQPRSGIAGPKTRDALLGRPSSGNPLPPVTGADYSKRYYCMGGACHLFVRRATTRRFARWIEAHPTSSAIAGGALIEGACEALKLAKAVKQVRFICGVLGGVAAERVGDRLKEAARQGACLRLSIGPVLSGKLLTAAPDDTWRCSD